MATATTTKRPRKSTSAKAPKATPEAPAAAEPATEQAATPTDTGAALTAAYWAAIDSRNNNGDIAGAQLTKVKDAYTRTDPKRRANLVKTLALQSGERIVNDDGEVDQSIALARKQLSAALAEVREETSRSERPPHDPVPHVVAIREAIARWIAAELVEPLTNDQRERMADIEVTDDDAKAADAAVAKDLERIAHHAHNGRNGHSGPRAPIADVEAKVIKAVHDAHPRPLTTAELAKAAGIPQATAYTRWTKTKTPGVTATTDDQGRKVFVKDTDAA